MVDHALFPALALLVGAAFAAQTLLGFGAGVITLTLGAHAFPLEDLLGAFVPLSVLQTSVVLLRARGEVAWRLLLTTLLPGMALGTALGLVLYDAIAGPLVERVYGVVVVAIVLLERGRASRPTRPREDQAAPPGPSAVTRLGTVASGVLQGLYASGGPLLVALLARLDLEKATFRTTLSAMWWTINVGLIAAYLARGRIDEETVPALLYLAPVVLLAIPLGELALRRIDPARFRLVVHAVLACAGVSLVV